MSKRVAYSQELESKIRAAIGDPEFDTSSVTVYEAKFLSTEPVKKNGFYNGARMTTTTIHEMAEFMSQPGNAIPLHIMHEDSFLPVGKVISAKAIAMNNGETELRGQFYLPNSETELINKIDTSVIDEVSVQVKSQHAFCSECGHDFFPLNQDNWVDFFTGTCPNDHVIGQNGVHARLHKMEDWVELSLVGKGAAKKAKILPRAKQALAMSGTMADRLSADKTLEASMLTASCKLNKGEVKMSAEYDALLSKYDAKVVEFAQLSAELSAAKEKLAAKDAEVTALTTDLTKEKEKVEKLEKDSKESDVAVVQDKLAASEKELKDATEKLLPHAKAALVASGMAEADTPTTLLAAAEAIEKAGLKLHQAVNAGNSTTPGSKDDVDEAGLKAAEERRKGSFKL